MVITDEKSGYDHVRLSAEIFWYSVWGLCNGIYTSTFWV